MGKTKGGQEKNETVWQDSNSAGGVHGGHKNMTDRQKTADRKSIIREYLESIIIAVILAFIIRTFVVQAFKIPSGSMRPTLQEGDRLLVNKFIYRFKEPQRGDIIVFKFPDNPKKDFIKRLIAKSGEEIKIREGNVYINGNLITDPYIKDVRYYNSGSLEDENSAYIVPENSYFVMGDNSANSRDSRFWGCVPEKNVLGKAFVIYWPPSRITRLK